MFLMGRADLYGRLGLCAAGIKKNGSGGRLYSWPEPFLWFYGGRGERGLFVLVPAFVLFYAVVFCFGPGYGVVVLVGTEHALAILLLERGDGVGDGSAGLVHDFDHPQGVGGSVEAIEGGAQAEEVPVGGFFEGEFYAAFVEYLFKGEGGECRHVGSLAHLVESLEGFGLVAESELHFGVVEQEFCVAPDDVVLLASVFAVLEEVCCWVEEFSHVVSCSGYGSVSGSSVGCEVGSGLFFLFLAWCSVFRRRVFGTRRRRR